MRIAFDYQAFWMQEYGGISRYFYSLCRDFIDSRSDVHIVSPIYRNKYIRDLNPEMALGCYVEKYPRYSSTVIRHINSTISPLLLSKLSPSIIHSTYFYENYNKPRFQNARKVLTIYDLIHEKYGDQCKDSSDTIRLKKRAIINNDHIICISHKTKADLQEYYDVPGEKVSVTHLGVDPTFLNFNGSHIDHIEHPCPDLYKIFAGKPYLLYVGSREGYKNFLFLLEALCKLDFFFSEFNLVCYGGGPLKKIEADILYKYNVEISSVLFLSGSDKNLAMLYKNAVAFIYPSLYEGFGIPPLEAMSVGCAVISSDGGSMPEILCDAAAYFDPQNYESIMFQLCNVLQNEGFRKKLIERGNVLSKNYTWDKCSKKTLAIYRSL